MCSRGDTASNVSSRHGTGTWRTGTLHVHPESTGATHRPGDGTGKGNRYRANSPSMELLYCFEPTIFSSPDSCSRVFTTCRGSRGHTTNVKPCLWPTPHRAARYTTSRERRAALTTSVTHMVPQHDAAKCVRTSRGFVNSTAAAQAVDPLRIDASRDGGLGKGACKWECQGDARLDTTPSMMQNDSSAQHKTDTTQQRRGAATCVTTLSFTPTKQPQNQQRIQSTVPRRSSAAG